MKLYRVGMLFQYNSFGFVYCSNKDEIAKEKQNWLGLHTKEQVKAGDVTIHVEDIDVTGTKASILDVLNKYATHPDNS